MAQSLPGEARVLVEVAARAQPEAVPPALPAVLGCIVKDMAALAERLEIAGRAIARIMVEMRAGEYHLGDPHRTKLDPGSDRDAPAAIAPPAARLAIPPAPIAEMRDTAQMGPPALFTARAGAVKTHGRRQLLPVNRIEPAVFGADRHADSMSQPQAEQKGNLPTR